jgi:hypothetical protein
MATHGALTSEYLCNAETYAAACPETESKESGGRDHRGSLD